MRRFLGGLYAAALGLAALCLVSIALLVLVQVVGRIVDRVLAGFGLEPMGMAVPSLAEIGGFLFVAAVFLALPGTLRAGGHVRVTMLLRLSGPTVRRVLTLLVLVMAVVLSGFAAWSAVAQAFDSWQFQSVSYGMVRIPLWIPQGAMALGLVVFCISLFDELADAAAGRIPAFRRSEQARENQGMG